MEFLKKISIWNNIRVSPSKAMKAKYTSKESTLWIETSPKSLA
jgi:hypothetical protein